MKKLLPFISTIFICNFSFSQTSTYHPFPDSNAVWNEKTSSFPGGVEYRNEYQNYISGDSILGGYHYHKILVTGVFSEYGFPSGNLISSSSYNGLNGFIRQDTLAKRVYTFDNNTQSDVLLYDFSLQTGDTLPHSYLHYSSDTLVVYSIDSLFDGTSYRKQINIAINGSPYIRIIEGIGSINGLFVPLYLFIDFYGVLHCFMQNGSIFFTDSSWSACQWTSAESVLYSSNVHVSISPNPFHTTATLNVDFRMQNVELRIYNPIGSLVRQSTFYNLKSTIIQRGDLSDGMYFYELRTKNYELLGTGKFVIN